MDDVATEDEALIGKILNLSKNSTQTHALLKDILKDKPSKIVGNHEKVSSAKDCPFGTQTNNNGITGTSEIFCLPEGVPSSVNNNN